MLTLLPAPRDLTLTPDRFALLPERLILLDSAEPWALRFTAGRLQTELERSAGLAWNLVASPATPAALVAATLRVRPGLVAHSQGYRLSISAEGILVEAGTEAGLFYGVSTLIQIVGHSDGALPGVRIADWPDYPVRGVMLDISRDKVPTMDTFYALVERLAGWKINQLQLYTEHTFAYRQHPEVWAAASPVTGQEVLDLDAFCRQRFIELVPNQNSFGHMHRWLAHPRYASLAETHDEFDTPWNVRMRGPFSLCPLDPGSLALVESLYDELLPHFSSRLFNAGCDEAVDLGQGRSQAECAVRGTGRVYLDFLRQIHAAVSRRGRTLQFWGDIIVEHPDLIPELPRDAIALEWGYQADHPFEAHGALFQAAGLEYYACPGTSSWCSIAGRTDNALANLRCAAEQGLKHGASGYLITDWGDRGHWQMQAVSYLGLASGAALGWALEANRGLDFAAAASRFAFDDPNGALGRAAYDLGNVYRTLGFEPHNSSVLFWILQLPLAELRAQYGGALKPEAFANALAAIEAAAQPLGRAPASTPEAALSRRELEWTARLLRHACGRGQMAFGLDGPSPSALRSDLAELLAEHEALWLARNRPGGLADSQARFHVGAFN